ncbi:MAG: RNA 2',3'-cyclic phosphodiesterase [candidate division NC10 bacterium]|nr:RNA 2',3'-cyclic phosphodiesterase [candidate division NC10 bacterium]
MRLFVAVNLPSEVRERLAAVQDRLRRAQADVSWVRAENIHVTLKFLGDVEAKRLERVRPALAEEARAGAPFSMEVSGVGSFGGRIPRVVWVGVGDGAEPLTRLAGQVEDGLGRVGFPKERRGFAAHLTVGRVRSPRNAEALLAALGEERTEPFGVAEVTQFDLMQSELRPSGSVYSVLEKFPLGSRSG